ncbi:hypothetical protein O0L34_g8286 [Tuta absoluta]|nr:hypothetical protein O0L34_g8286 [Tuta absoluta]
MIHRHFFIISMITVDGIYSKVSLQEQVEHVLKTRRDSEGHGNDLNIEMINSRRKIESGQPKQHRRYNFMLDQNNAGQIIGKPSLPSHLPAAEPILPGHTLLRPALGMLKSSIRFPHRELENGAGVLGNYNNLGLKYDGRNERVLYTGFRRNAPSSRRSYSVNSPSSGRRTLADYIMVVPSQGIANPRFSITNLVLDMNKEKQTIRNVMKKLKTLTQPVKTNKHLIMYVANPTGSSLFLNDLLKDTNHDSSEDNIEGYIIASLFNSRRDENVVEIDPNEEKEDVNEEVNITKEKKEKKKKEIAKREMFYASKNLFNTIKIHPDMINFEDLVPDLKSSEDNKKRKKDRAWWFYNQIDHNNFSPLEE